MKCPNGTPPFLDLILIMACEGIVEIVGIFEREISHYIFSPTPTVVAKKLPEIRAAKTPEK
jgi:hypothetical protein